MAKPFISVLMPAFNAEKHIAISIQSILVQTYTNFELLILDDGSTDLTFKRTAQFNDPRIKILKNDKNLGLVASRNKLVSAANGSYIAFMDADDIAHPLRLETQIAALEKNEFDVCGTSHFTLYENNQRIKKSKQFYSDSDIRAIMIVNSPFCNPSITGRAEVFKKYIFQSGSITGEDYILWLNLAIAGIRFANLKEVLMTYRVHDNQITQKNIANNPSSIQKIKEEYLAFLKIDTSLIPRALSWRHRIIIAPTFLVKLNTNIKHISFSANYQIYARFQFRGNGFYTPFTRFERFLFSTYATLIGSL